MESEQNMVKRVLKSRRKLEKASKRLVKAKKWRIWVEENEHVHLINYPFYRAKYYLEKLWQVN